MVSINIRIAQKSTYIYQNLKMFFGISKTFSKPDTENGGTPKLYADAPSVASF